MAKIDELRQLIESLSKTEKRRFRLDCGSNGADKHYLALFDFYLRHPGADAKTVKQAFASRAHPQLSVQNNYLYQRILSSLKSSHQRGSIDFQIREWIQQAEVLFDRDLMLQAEATLKRAEKLAAAFHRHALLCDIYNLQRKIIVTKDGAPQALERLTLWADQYGDAIACLRENVALWSALFKLSEQQPLPASKATTRLLTNSDNLQANILRQHIRFANSILNNQVEQGMEAITQLIDLLEQHPALIEDDPNGYVTSVNNKISILLYIDKKDEILPLFERLHQLHKHYRIRSVNPSLNRQLLRSYNIELEYHRERCHFDQGWRLIPAVNEFLEKNKSIVPADYWLMIYYQFAFFSFVAGEFRQATQWLNKLNRISPPGLRPDIRLQAKLLNLFLLYQFNQLNALKYAIDNCRRFIKKQNLHTEFNETVLKIFSRLCRLDAKRSDNDAEQSVTALTQFPQTPETRAYIEWFSRH